jgi:uncharacterized spore protein YtfJ
MTQTVAELASILARVGVRAAFGDAVEIDGAAAVPVAVTAFAFGGGSGRLFPVAGNGSAGTGGLLAIPVGFLANRDGVVRFVPNAVPVLAVTVPLVCAAGIAAAAVTLAAKRRPRIAGDESTLERMRRRIIGLETAEKRSLLAPVTRTRRR